MRLDTVIVEKAENIHGHASGNAWIRRSSSLGKEERSTMDLLGYSRVRHGIYTHRWERRTSSANKSRVSIVRSAGVKFWEASNSVWVERAKCFRSEKSKRQSVCVSQWWEPPMCSDSNRIDEGENVGSTEILGWVSDERRVLNAADYESIGPRAAGRQMGPYNYSSSAGHREWAG